MIGIDDTENFRFISGLFFFFIYLFYFGLFLHCPGSKLAIKLSNKFPRTEILSTLQITAGNTYLPKEDGKWKSRWLCHHGNCSKSPSKITLTLQLQGPSLSSPPVKTHLAGRVCVSSKGQGVRHCLTHWQSREKPSHPAERLMSSGHLAESTPSSRITRVHIQEIIHWIKQSLNSPLPMWLKSGLRGKPEPEHF